MPTSRASAFRSATPRSRSRNRSGRWFGVDPGRCGMHRSRPACARAAQPGGRPRGSALIAAKASRSAVAEGPQDQAGRLDHGLGLIAAGPASARRKGPGRRSRKKPQAARWVARKSRSNSADQHPLLVASRSRGDQVAAMVGDEARAIEPLTAVGVAVPGLEADPVGADDRDHVGDGMALHRAAPRQGGVERRRRAAPSRWRWDRAAPRRPSGSWRGRLPGTTGPSRCRRPDAAETSCPRP